MVNSLKGASMPSDIRIIRAHEFIQATPEGKVDLDRAKEVLIEVASASTPSDNYDVVLDARNVQFEMDAADLWELAAELHKVRQAFSLRTAVIVPKERSDYAGFFAMCAQERGFDLSAFTRLGDAMEWLDRTDG
jgi:anti-anti-sigma regulatory factor